jgi:hypothetical protein
MYEILEYTQVDKAEVVEFSQQASLYTEDPAHKNMISLPHLLYESDRLKNNNGTYYFLKINGTIEIGSGVYISNFDKHVALGGLRSWVNEEYRGKFLIGTYLLPKQLKWAEDRNLKTFAITLNDYNLKYLSYFRRSGLGLKKDRKPGRVFYNGQYEVEFPCNIRGVKQRVLYHKIDKSYNPNWKKIRWQYK